MSATEIETLLRRIAGISKKSVLQNALRNTKSEFLSNEKPSRTLIQFQDDKESFDDATTIQKTEKSSLNSSNNSVDSELTSTTVTSASVSASVPQEELKYEIEKAISCMENEIQKIENLLRRNTLEEVESLIYWRDPKKSGIVFGGTLIILLSLSYFSLISVFAYLSLISLVGTISFRIYKNVLQAVQKTSDGHPFKDFLEADIQLPQDKVRELSEIAVTHLNAAALELRRLFLVEDLVDSIKFGVTLWVMTYVGAWFNGMTLLIIAFVALFTLPKVYENNKAQIDANLDIVRTKVAEITSKRVEIPEAIFTPMDPYTNHPSN